MNRLKSSRTISHIKLKFINHIEQIKSLEMILRVWSKFIDNLCHLPFSSPAQAPNGRSTGPWIISLIRLKPAYCPKISPATRVSSEREDRGGARERGQMGAEGEEEKTETKPNPISEVQFRSWKRRKVGSSLYILLSYSSWIRSFHLSYCRPIVPKLIENVLSAFNFTAKIYIEINEGCSFSWRCWMPISYEVVIFAGLMGFWSNFDMGCGNFRPSSNFH